MRWTPTFDDSRLALVEVAEIPASLVPYLAAAAAQLAFLSGISWAFSTDDPPVALLRMIAKATTLHPEVGGAHTSRLLHELEHLDQTRLPGGSR